MKKILVLLIAFVLISSYSNAERNLDSLLELSDSKAETPEQVDILNEISFVYYRNYKKEEQKAYHKYSNKAIKLARKIDYKNGLFNALYYQGANFMSTDNAASTAKFLEALDLARQIGNKRDESRCLMQLGLISYILHNYETAAKSFQKSMNVYNNKTSRYLLAICYTELDSTTLAKSLFKRVIADATVSREKFRLMECDLWLGRLYLKTNRLDSASYYLNKSINSYKLVKGSNRLIRPYAFISEMYLRQNKIEKAIYYAQKSIELESVQEIVNKDPERLIQATKILNKAFVLKKDFKKAHYYQEINSKTKNKLLEGNIKEKVADMQSMFEFNRKMDIKEQEVNQERILRNTFIGGSLILLLFLLVLYSRFNIKKKANVALHELNKEINFEKKRSDDLLLNILPADIAKELKETGEAKAQRFENVSVLFTDFVDFTKTSEKLSPTELINEINECFKNFDRTMKQYGIEKIKTIGDAYMAAGGLPLANEDSVKNTLMAAIDIQKFITQRKQEKEAKGEAAFDMRVGIHTGAVVAGIVGENKFQYDIWGDTVNTAARTESHGEVGKVNISQATYELIKELPEFSFEHRGKIAAKGKGEINMYFVSK